MSDVRIFFVVGLGLILGGNFILLELLESTRFLNLTWKRRGRTATIIGMLTQLLCLPVACYFALISARLEGMGTDDMWSQTVSPDGTYTAYVFTRDCGASDSGHEMVSRVLLRETSRPLKFEEKHIVEDTDWLGRPNSSVIYSGELAGLRWTSDNHLMVRFDATSSSPGDTNWNGITISYVPENPHASALKTKSRTQDYALR